MPFIRFQIDGAVDKPTYDALPMVTKLAIRDHFRQLKSLCSKINEGTPNEEDTVRFKYHICHHDAGLPCEESQDIE